MRIDAIAIAWRWRVAAPVALANLAVAAIIALSAPPAFSQEEKANAPKPMSREVVQAAREKGMDPHSKIFQESSYPPAAICGSCHTQIYKEWSSSNHAYASISPMFHKFEQLINDLSSGTVRSFCVRCHQTVGTQRGEPRAQALWERSQVAREGVTCITCHRITEEYAKTNGQRTVQPGDISRGVTGTGIGSKFNEVLRNKDEYRITQSPGERGNQIHNSVFKFPQINKSQFCLSCHQVAVHPGIKLEVVWDQYRASPAMAKGTTCQDCHMGRVPGVAAGYARAPSAVVNDKLINPDRKHSNHAFYGPGYPIAHPGIFPHNAKGAETKIEDWLTFNWRAGWGEPEWEDKLEKSGGKGNFPKKWADRIDREEAREVIKENLAALEDKKKLRKQVMENGSKTDGPFFDGKPAVGSDLNFSYRIKNINPGHNMPSGSLGAQPEIWVNVSLIGPDGKRLWESGYVDSHGDMADLHSLDVRAGKLPHDDQLVNLQTKFLTQGVTGTDREMYLPVNFDFDQLPFIRPSGVPSTVLNHPPGIRMEQRSIPPLGEMIAKYKIPGSLLTKPGKYTLAFRMRSRAEPIYFMKFVKATIEMERSMNQWMLDMHPMSATFEVR
ncbi:MAG: multiheme c-type cytochrome [Alphaproteobacteria bacterium]|nr:multiheme c-type cytochrome [Alphaproteobacteria bacterium]